MSVRKVWKVPAPGRPEAAWGYLTNSYVLPTERDKGAGSDLLQFIKSWARREKLELLIVWPSDAAYIFYERAGFERPGDPLVLKLTEEWLQARRNPRHLTIFCELCSYDLRTAFI